MSTSTPPAPPPPTRQTLPAHTPTVLPIHLPNRWCSVPGCPARALGYVRLCLLNEPPARSTITRQTFFFCAYHRHAVLASTRAAFSQSPPDVPSPPAHDPGP